MGERESFTARRSGPSLERPLENSTSPHRPRFPMLSKRSLGLFSRYCKPGPHSRRGAVYTIHTARLSNVSRQHRSISRPSSEVLENLGLFFAGFLTARDNCHTRAAESAIQGGEKYMTSKEMHRHLNHIQGLVPPRSRVHFQIETIVFRTSAMLQGDRCIALKPEDGSWPLEVPFLERSGTRKLYGPTGYSVGLAANFEKRRLSQTPS